MSDSQSRRICLVPHLSGVGGMVSFQEKLSSGLREREISICYDLDELPYDCVLVIGGTRRIDRLFALRRQGIPIFQRLNGMNWLHKVRAQKGKRSSSFRHYIRSEYGNLILRIIRSQLADGIVYQSEFAQGWWEREFGETRVRHTVVYNGVDLQKYNPDGAHQRPMDVYRLLLVEGSLMGGYETGLESAVQLAAGLANEYALKNSARIELVVAGRVSPEMKAIFERRIEKSPSLQNFSLIWAGLLSKESIPEFDRSAHLLFSSDLNAACPNSTIEALACGLPVVAFNTGSLPELVTGDSGRIVPYGGDPWRLDPPDIPALVKASQEILDDQACFRLSARRRAEEKFGLDMMVDQYLKFFNLD